MSSKDTYGFDTPNKIYRKIKIKQKKTRSIVVLTRFKRNYMQTIAICKHQL